MRCKKKEEVKEMNEEYMTDEQFKFMLKLIIQVIKDSESKEDAVRKIEELLK